MMSPEDYMLPCLSKQLLNMECFGCGLQRATVLVFKGDFLAAFQMYPAIYSLILLVLYLIFSAFYKFKYSETIKFILVISTVSIIIINYIIKITN